MPPTPKRGNISRSTLSSIDAGRPRLDGLNPSPWLSKRNSVRAKPSRAFSTRRVRHRPVVVDDGVVGEVLLVDAPLGDGDVLGEEGRRRAERLAVRVAHEELLFVRELVIDARVEVVHVQLGRCRSRSSSAAPVVGLPGLVGQREVLQDLAARPDPSGPPGSRCRRTDRG